MLQLKGKTLEQTINDFNNESWRVNALNYNDFLNSDFYQDKSIMDILYLLQAVEYSPNIDINKRFSNKLNIDLVLEFYNSIGLKEQVEPIILGQHPIFETFIDKNLHSFVGHKENDSSITFSVGNTGTLNGVLNLAHECSHAINGHYRQMQIYIKEQNDILKNYSKDSKEFEEFKERFDKYLKEQSTFTHDLVTEVESSIIEKLFLDFLVNKNTISPDDKQLFLNRENNSFRNNLNLIFEENMIYNTIIRIKNKNKCHTADINEKEYLKMCSILKDHPHYIHAMERFCFIANRKKLNKTCWHSSFRFRYIVGEIISTIWIDKYNSSSTKEKEKMLEHLRIFISTNNELELQDTVNLLLKDETYETIINKFINFHSSKTSEI